MEAKRIKLARGLTSNPNKKEASDVSTIALHDLKSFIPSTVDHFLEETEEMLKAAKARQSLGELDKCLKYQRLIQDQLTRLVRVADLQRNHSGIDEEPEELPDETGADDSDMEEVECNIIGPSGSKAVWTNEELDKLYRAAQGSDCTLTKANMIRIAAEVGTKTAAQCRGKLVQLSNSEKVTHDWLAEKLKHFSSTIAAKKNTEKNSKENS